MSNPYKRLYNTNGHTVCRDAETAADASGWVPEDEGTPSDVILDAREWERIQIRPEFDTDPGGTGSVTVQLLKRVPTGSGYEWIEEGAVVILEKQSADFIVDGHFVAFRIGAVTLGTANNVSVVATGGQWLRPRL